MTSKGFMKRTGPEMVVKSKSTFRFGLIYQLKEGFLFSASQTLAVLHSASVLLAFFGKDLQKKESVYFSLHNHRFCCRCGERHTHPCFPPSRFFPVPLNVCNKRGVAFAWVHTAVKARHPVRSGKLSTAGFD